jgi:hypothetical protein
MKQKIALLFGIMVSFFLLSSCASTKLTSGWHDAKYDKPLQIIMVVGVSDDEKKRRVFEDVFVERFEKNGIKAISSMRVIPPGTALNEDTVQGAALERGVDAILVTHLIRAGIETVYGPSPTGGARWRDYGDFGDYYDMARSDAQQTDYVSRKMLVRLQNNLYDTKTEKLIWTATSESVEPKTVRQIVESLSGPVMTDLRNRKLIQ